MQRSKSSDMSVQENLVSPETIEVIDTSDSSTPKKKKKLKNKPFKDPSEYINMTKENEDDQLVPTTPNKKSKKNKKNLGDTHIKEETILEDSSTDKQIVDKSKNNSNETTTFVQDATKKVKLENENNCEITETKKKKKKKKEHHVSFEEDEGKTKVKAEPNKNLTDLEINLNLGNGEFYLMNDTDDHLDDDVFLVNDIANVKEKTLSKDESSSAHIKNNITWPKEDLSELINKIKAAIPEDDKVRYTLRLSRLNWDSFAFNNYTGDECRKMWDFIQKKVRCFRLLSEVVNDAQKWIEKPFKKNKHPDMPRRPLSYYLLFYLEQKKKLKLKHPNLDHITIAKRIGEKYQQLTPEEKEKYIKLATAEKKEYEKKLEAFYALHPECIPKTSKFNQVPKKPFTLFYENKLEKADQTVDKMALREKYKEKWKKLSNKKKLCWINLALSQTSENPSQAAEFKKRLSSILTKEEKQLKDEEAGKPKKPPASAYSLFVSNKVHNEQFKDMPYKSRMVQVGQMWKNLSLEEKQKYKDEFNKITENYNVQYFKYLDSLTPKERIEEMLLSSQRKRKRNSTTDSNPQSSVPAVEINEEQDEPNKSNSKKAKLSSNTLFVLPEMKPIYPGEPILPPATPFLIFAKKMLKTRKQITKAEMNQLWTNLSKSQQLKYHTKLTELEQKYIVDYEKFLKSLSQNELKEYSKIKAEQTALSDETDGSEDDSENLETDSDGESSSIAN